MNIPEKATFKNWPTCIDYWLSRFVLEVRKKNGNVYTPNSLVHHCSGIMRQIRRAEKPKIVFYKDEALSSSCKTLNAEMKRLHAQSQGIGSEKNKLRLSHKRNISGRIAYWWPFSKELLNTMIFFALRSGNKHRQLRLCPCQIQVMEPLSEKPYLKYIEDNSKNRFASKAGEYHQRRLFFMQSSKVLCVSISDVHSSLSSWCSSRIFLPATTKVTNIKLLVFWTTSWSFESRHYSSLSRLSNNVDE